MNTFQKYNGVVDESLVPALLDNSQPPCVHRLDGSLDVNLSTVAESAVKFLTVPKT